MALTCLKGDTECGNNYVKKRIYSALSAKGLSNQFVHTCVMYQEALQNYI